LGCNTHNTEHRRELFSRRHSPWHVIFVTVFPMQAHSVPARKAAADGALTRGFRTVEWSIYGIQCVCVSSSWNCDVKNPVKSNELHIRVRRT
jgi:hypothetical protein